MNYLFICLGNRDRSPTAERYCKEKYRKKGHKFRSRGIGVVEPIYYQFSGHTSRPILSKDLEWADEIWIMDEGLRKKLTAKYPSYQGKIIVLGIEDIYDTGYENDRITLREVLERKITSDAQGNLKVTEG